MAPKDPDLVFSWEEVAAALFVKKGITSGLWRIGVRLRFAAANTGPSDDLMMPSGVMGIDAVALTKVDALGPLVFSASPGVGRTVRKKSTGKQAR